MKEIELSCGKTVQVDDWYYPELNKHNWCAVNGKYAVRRVYKNGKVTNQYLHRWIVEAPKGFTVVFKDYNSLNCQLSNLCIMSDKEARRYARTPKKRREVQCSS